MHGFIEVTTMEDREKVLINTAWIQMVVPKTGCTMIFFAFNVPHAAERDYVVASEDYETVREKLEYAMR